MTRTRVPFPPDPRVLLELAAQILELATRVIRMRRQPDTHQLARQVSATADLLAALQQASAVRGVDPPAEVTPATMHLWALELSAATPRHSLWRRRR